MQRPSGDIRKYDTSDTSYNIVYQLSGILEADSDAGSLVGAAQGRESVRAIATTCWSRFYLAQVGDLLTYTY